MPREFDGRTAPPLRNASEKRRKSRIVEIEITRDLVKFWKIPEYQRHVKEHGPRVKQVIEDLNANNDLDTIIVVGVVGRNEVLYLVDGHHRKFCFEGSNQNSIIADVKFKYFDTMEEMALFYEKMQGQISTSTADDRLKSLEPCWKPLEFIRKSCDFITYDRVNPNSSKHVINMSTVIRSWFDSKPELPHKSKGQLTFTELAKKIDGGDAQKIVDFLLLCRSKWTTGKDERPLWNHINLTLGLWLYRRLILTEPKSLTDRQFGIGLGGVREEDHILLLNHKKLDKEMDRRMVYESFIKLFRSQLVAASIKCRVRILKPDWAKKT